MAIVCRIAKGTKFIWKYKMKITKKSQIVDYCEWFLKEVKRPARANEITAYMIKNKDNGNRLGVRPESFSVRMKMEPGRFYCEKKRGGLVWDLVGG